MTRFFKSCVVVTALAVMAGAASGAVIISDEGTGWTVDSALSGPPPWTDTINQDLTSVWGSSTPSGDSTGVGFSGPQTQGMGGPFDDYIAESAQLTGDLSSLGVFGAIFQFYDDSSSYQPAEVSLYFSSDGGTYEWYYDLALPVDGWQSYVVLFQFDNGWYDVLGGGGSTEFDTALSSVDEMGIRILYGNGVTVDQQYGIADFTLHDEGSFYVPEPSTYILLSTVLMSLGFTFGRKKKEVVTA